MVNPLEKFRALIDPETRVMCDILSSEPDVSSFSLNQELIKTYPSRLLNTLRRHRLYPAFYNRWKLLNAPEKFNVFNASIKQLVDQNRLQMLLKTTWAVKITKAFSDSDIPVIAIKGPALAHQLYGDGCMKASIDLDLLIQSINFDAALQLLNQLGFNTDFPYTFTSCQKKYLLNSFHHLGFRNNNLHVELHWELSTNKFMAGFSIDEVFRSSQKINIAGVEVSVLNPTVLALYLAIHGSYHAWARLDWLYDFTSAMHKLAGAEDSINDLIRKNCLEKIMAQSIQLSHLFFHAKLPLLNLGHPSPLLKPAVMAIGHAYSNTREQKLLQKLYLFRLKTNWRYRLQVFTVLGTNTGDWKLLRLPNYLFFLYFVLRPFLYLYQAFLKKGP